MFSVRTLVSKHTLILAVTFAIFGQIAEIFIFRWKISLIIHALFYTFKLFFPDSGLFVFASFYPFPSLHAVGPG